MNLQRCELEELSSIWAVVLRYFGVSKVKFGRIKKIDLFIMCLLLFSCGKEEKLQQVVDVESYVVDSRSIPMVYQFVGVCESSHKVEIWSRVEGYLNKVNYIEGGAVKEGDVLFEIDPREFASNVAQAEANLEREKANLWSAQKSVDRYWPLYQEKAASRKDWEDASSQLLAQQATVNMYEAKLEEAKLNLSYTKITSPISGLTTSSAYSQGTLINPAVNGLLTTVSVIDPMWVVVHVSDSYFLSSAGEIASGQLVVPDNFRFNVNLTLADGTVYPHTGSVDFISPVLDPNTGTLIARGVFPNPNGLLKPGQFVRAQVSGAERLNTIIIPQSCVLQGENGRYVYVIIGNRVEMRDVETGDWYQDYWIIKSGLKEGDEVISVGVNKVKEGMIVSVTNRNKKKKTLK
ncbi:MAG: efflux RND transporter periplasmic adaptor subunit [Chlamydiae bacterium CG10_big_fil_rev_8_21_14_0_10_42_34]|nr:MAG: efflux RND transporter periplasmic adaptor subunit [Chlamydiae bacterium CG10_big_fil_rev_8_21_14_0_10_42_34]